VQIFSPGEAADFCRAYVQGNDHILGLWDKLRHNVLNLSELSFGVIFVRNTHSAVETLSRFKGIYF